MTFFDLVSIVARGAFLLLFVVSLVNLLLHRDRTHLDIALVFAALTASILTDTILQFTGIVAPWLKQAALFAVLAEPYFLLRIVRYFQPVPRRLFWFAIAGMLYSWVVILFLPSTVSVLPSLLALGYFILVNLYASFSFVRGAFTTAGVTRQRLKLASIGTGLLALLIGVLIVVALVPAVGTSGAALLQVIGVACATAYFLGFSPPRALRRTWQLSELYNFLTELMGQPLTRRAEATVHTLCRAAERVVGGSAAAALWDPLQQKFVIQAMPEGMFDANEFSLAGGVIEQTWRDHRPRLALRGEPLGLSRLQLAPALHLESVFVVPIRSAEREWGLLLIVLRRVPLFLQDDTMMLALLTEQCALALENVSLVNTQRDLIGQLQAWNESLEQRVDERTRKLVLAQDETRQLNQELERRVQERTTQLREANQELEAFSYSVSHDLRAPLRHINGFVSLLTRHAAPRLDEQDLHYLRSISDAANHMAALVEALLAFSRIGRTELHHTRINLDDLVQSTVRDLSSETQEREINWQIQALPETFGDPILLRQVMQNLISNAIKYTTPRSPACIHIGATSDENEHIVFVRDNGVGFDMRYVDKLFGVFQRLHRSEEFEGTGIGLANVRRIIARHGGRTWAEGAVDQGATLFFTLPISANGDNRQRSAP